MKQINSLPALSIIVPVYNTESRLAQCLGSLLKQTIKNIEIICIDDKSVDDSLQILREYEKKDNRVKVIKLKENSGASIARNAGLAMATGEYIGFVDSDDFVDVNFYERLYNRATATGADIAKGEVREISCDGKSKNYGPSFADINKNKVNFYCPFSSAIYKRDFITKNKLNFPIGVTISEDTVFLMKAVILSNKIELVGGVYYHYVRQKYSLSSGNLSIEKLESWIKGKNMIVDFINDKVDCNEEIYRIVFVREFEGLLYSIYSRSKFFDGHLIVIRGSIELYGKCKCKNDLSRIIGKSHSAFLSEKNEVGLFIDLSERANKVISFKLFNFIPVLKIIHRFGVVEIVLFRFIPLLKVIRKRGECYYYLFFCLYVMRKEVNR